MTQPEGSRFRAKPVEVEARQVTAENKEEICDWIDEREKDVHPCNKTLASVTTHYGKPIVMSVGTTDLFANVGDWIIRDIDGAFRPCEDEIFERSYEAA